MSLSLSGTDSLCDRAQQKRYCQTRYSRQGKLISLTHSHTLSFFLSPVLTALSNEINKARVAYEELVHEAFNADR
jgi:hypothetical protein